MQRRHKKKSSDVLLRENLTGEVIVSVIFEKEGKNKYVKIEGKLDGMVWEKSVTISGSVIPLIGWNVGIVRITAQKGRRVLYENAFSFKRYENSAEQASHINTLRKKKFPKAEELPHHTLRTLIIKDSKTLRTRTEAA